MSVVDMSNLGKSIDFCELRLAVGEKKDIYILLFHVYAKSYTNLVFLQAAVKDPDRLWSAVDL